MKRIRDQHRLSLIIPSSSWLGAELLSVKGAYNLPTSVTFSLNIKTCNKLMETYEADNYTVVIQENSSILRKYIIKYSGLRSHDLNNLFSNHLEKTICKHDYIT